MIRFMTSPPYHAFFSAVSLAYHIALPTALFYIGYGLNHH